MTSAEKKSIYELFKAASCCYTGYTPQDFAGEIPDFKDDVETTVHAENNNAEQKNQAKDTAVQAVQTVQSAQAEKPQTVEQAKKTAPMTLDTLFEKVKNCTNCILSRNRKNSVFGEGVAYPIVLVIGDSPEENDTNTGRIFSAEAGVLLDKMLSAISLSRTTNTYVANLVKCPTSMGRFPMNDEISSCSGFLQAQIHILKPKYILAMGRTSAQSLLKSGQGMNALHGKWFEYNGIPLMPTYHPAELLRDVNLKRPAWEDLKMFKRELMNKNLLS